MVFIWIRLTMQVLHLTTVQCPFKATRWQHCTRYSDYAFVLYGSSSHLKSSVRGYQEEVTQMCCTESDKFKTIYCSLLFVTGSVNDLSMFETDFIFKTDCFYIYHFSSGGIFPCTFEGCTLNNIVFLCRYQGHHILLVSRLHT